MSTNLREGTAVVSAEGRLAEKNLEISKENGVDVIRGTVTIKISDTDSITFQVRSAAKKSDGKGGYTNEDNKTYQGLVTVYNEYKTIAEVGEENADYVRVTRGTLRPYYNVRSGREINSMSANFFNRVFDPTDEPSATFEVECYISSIVPEKYRDEDHQGEDTGRAIVKAWLPTYSGIEPIEFVAPKDYGVADAFLSGDYQPGQTVTFYGDVVNKKVVKIATIPVKIGKPKTTTSTTYTNELVITGASEPEQDEAKAFNANAVRAAITEREARIEEQKRKDATGTVRPAPNGFMPAPTSGRSLPF